MYQRQFEATWDGFTSEDGASGYRVPILLPSGYVWRIDRFYVMAMTNYAAQDTNYQTFTLYNSSGNAIASVANGPATGGLAIGPHVTGVDSTMTSTYQYVDASSAASYLYVTTASTGAGRDMTGIRVVVLATPLRAAQSALS